MIRSLSSTATPAPLRATRPEVATTEETPTETTSDPAEQVELGSSQPAKAGLPPQDTMMGFPWGILIEPGIEVSVYFIKKLIDFFFNPEAKPEVKSEVAALPAQHDGYLIAH
ncbi:MAG: hypothetical protein AB7S38_24200 [Vulcanimicrobiota bacterium]